jgi:hypothetical protein
MPERQKLDFQAIKDAVTLEQVMNLLNLPARKSGGQYRCDCPAHPGNARGLAITPDRGFYCFAEKKGGDCIALYAHVRECNNYDAALALSQHFRVGGKSADPPRAEERQPAHTTRQPAPQTRDLAQDGGLQPLSYLEPQHEVLDLLGLSPAVCEALGAGYAPKGTMIGRICFPLRLPDGALIGYVGLATKPDQVPLLKFPNNMEEMCGNTRQPEQEEPPKPAVNDMRKILRVV